MQTKQIGEIAVLSVAKKLAEKGIRVAFPFGDFARYDLLLELHGRFARIQVKSVQNNDGTLRTVLSSGGKQGTQFIRKRYTPAEIDALIAYNCSTDSLYILPPTILQHSKVYLRLEPTKNNQAKGILWAKDYENALQNICWK